VAGPCTVWYRAGPLPFVEGDCCDDNDK
jgi:hypothetical protein